VPDGYTVMMVAAGFVMNPALKKNLPYDPARDFTALGLVADVPAGLVVHPALPARDVKQLMAMARARPGQLNFGSAGPGSVSHLAGVLFNLAAKVDTVHVPYKSSGPSLVDLIAGQIAFSFPTVSGALPHVGSGKLRLLAQTGVKRSLLLKDTPTVQEAGLPGLVVNSGFGYVGPGGMPAPVVESLNSALVKTATRPRNMILTLNPKSRSGLPWARRRASGKNSVLCKYLILKEFKSCFLKACRRAWLGHRASTSSARTV
jgi:tripartite-type tricarboxylate transporter receptor subunit TctC